MSNAERRPNFNTHFIIQGVLVYGLDLVKVILVELAHKAGKIRVLVDHG
jgi:hypothetical protein